VITNLKNYLKTGAGKKVKIRDIIEHFHEADIIVDSQAPLIRNILLWIKETKEE